MPGRGERQRTGRRLLTMAVQKSRESPSDQTRTYKLLEVAMRGIALLLGVIAAIGLTGIEARAATATAQAEPPAGLGVEIIVDKGVVKVVTPFDDGPAAKAGVMAGDVITHVDDVPLQHLPRADVIDKLRGPANSTALLRLIRAGQNKPVELSIVRETIRIPAVRT